MARSYFVLVHANREADERTIIEAALSTAGMRQRIATPFFTVFASDQIGALILPGHGIILGDLYRRDGHPATRTSDLPTPTSAGAFRTQILTHYWGDYVLVQPTEGDSSGIRATRSPSPACDLQCVYSLIGGRGFLTSDITLAERANLYRRRVDFQHLAHRLAYPGLKSDSTGLAGIRELLPGCSIELRNKTVHIERDWNPWDFVGDQIRDSDQNEAASAVRSSIETVIRVWASEDKSILLESSGGLDSSIVGACLKGTPARLTCATLTTSVPGADEREYASLVADGLGVDLLASELTYGDAKLQFPIAPELVTPAVGPLQYAIDVTMRDIADRENTGSYYSGGGGDTVFGYLTNATPAADAFLAAGLATGLRTVREISEFHQCTYWKASRLTLRRLASGRRTPHRTDLSLLPRNAPLPDSEPHPWLEHPGAPLPGCLQRVYELSSTQFFRDSCPRSLARRMRMPLLSQPVIEACLRVPSWMWFHGGQNRAIARLAFSHELPPRILARRSKGTFTAYLGAIYRRRMKDMLDLLLGGELEAHRLLDTGKLLEMAERDIPRNDNAFMRLFQLCTYENWIREQTKMGR